MERKENNCWRLVFLLLLVFLSVVSGNVGLLLSNVRGVVDDLASVVVDHLILLLDKFLKQTLPPTKFLTPPSTLTFGHFSASWLLLASPASSWEGIARRTG